MIYTPTYGGSPIFGLAVEIDQEPNASAAQVDAFFGVPGNIQLFGGTRGRQFFISGILYDVDLPTVAADEQVFLPGVTGSYVDGIARNLVDTYNRLWPNVVYLGQYKRTAPPRPAVWATGDGPFAGWMIPYRAVFVGLS